MHSGHKVQGLEKWGDASVKCVNDYMPVSPQRFRTLPYPSVCTHVTTAQTVKQSSTKFGIQEIP